VAEVLDMQVVAEQVVSSIPHQSQFQVQIYRYQWVAVALVEQQLHRQEMTGPTEATLIFPVAESRLESQ
jgi:hypothetical protein